MLPAASQRSWQRWVASCRASKQHGSCAAAQRHRCYPCKLRYHWSPCCRLPIHAPAGSPSVQAEKLAALLAPTDLADIGKPVRAPASGT